MEFKRMMGYAAVAALAFGAASCSNDEAMTNAMAEAQKDLVVSVGINQANTRAGITASKFTSQESIGLYLYKGADFTADYPQVGTHKAKNAEYKENGGKWEVAQKGEGIVLSNQVGTIYAYYPYSAENAAVEADKINIEVKAAQGSGLSDGVKDVAEQSDFMYATKVGNVDNNTENVNLSMNHALAMLSFKFIKGDYPGEGLVQSIKVMNAEGKELLKTGKGTMNLNDGTVTAPASNGDITLTPNAKLAKGSEDEYAANEIARMLVYPIAAITAEDLKVQIQLDDKTYTLSVPVTEESNSYVAGKNYQYTFKLAGKEFGGEGSDDITVDIKPWVDVNAGSGDLISPDNQ